MSARIRLFLSSYVPLFVIVAIRTRDGTLCWVLLALAAFGGYSLFSLIRASKQIEPRRVKPSSVTDLGSEVASYLATYLLPFMMTEEPDARDLLAYSLTLAIVGVVFISSDMVGVNPLLYLVGFRVYAADGIRKSEMGNSRQSLLICARTWEIEANQPLKIADVAKGASLVISIEEDP